MMWMLGSKTQEVQKQKQMKKDLLHKHGTDITMLARLGMVDPAIGREEEMGLLIETLMKKPNSYACLVGGAGVAVVEALALKIVRYSVPPELIRKKIISIDMNCIVDGVMNREESEKRVEDMLDEVRDSEGGVILFVKDLHNFIKDDRIAYTLKVALARDEFKCISATSVEECRRYIERDGAMKHMLEIIQVCEPSIQHSNGVKCTQTPPASKHYMRKRKDAREPKTKELQKYGMARLGKLDSMIGRKEEMELLIEALMKKQNSNACLVGGAGVGKTTVVEALATKILGQSVPDKLLGKMVISIDMNCMVDSGKKIEKRVKDVLDEMGNIEGGVILFIEDLHNFIRCDRIAPILKVALARGDFKCIGATGEEEYRRYIESDAELKHAFETIHVCEPSREDSIEILKDIAHKYEAHHGVKYTQTALVSAVDLSKHYMRELLLPGKAISLIDKAGARARMLGFTYVTEVEIEHVVSKSAGVRLSQVFTEEEAASLLRLEDILNCSVIGQEEAVAAVCCSIKRARVGMRDETKPIGCFLFAGPTGVGKTEMAKVLAKEYFGSEAAVVRLDTRRYMENHALSRLIGQLVAEVRRRPHCLVLFDEIEKAHEEALNVVLQIVNGGRLSDGEGETVDFRDTIVIVISNAESHSYKAEVVNGFDQVVVFKPLEKEHMEKILEVTIEQFGARALSRNKVIVKVSGKLKEWLLSVGYDRRYGARALKRAFATSVEAKLADEILRGRVAPRDKVEMDITLIEDVECHVSRVKISRSGLDFDDARLVETKSIAYKDNKGRRVTETTIGGVDSELILPLLNKHRLRKLPRKGDGNGSKSTVEGVELQHFLPIVKSFYDSDLN